MSKNFWKRLADALARRPAIRPPGSLEPQISDSVPAKLSDGGVLLTHEAWTEWIDTTQPDDRWKLKLRVLRLQLVDRRDGIQLVDELTQAGYELGMSIALNEVDKMLGETEEEMLR